ncbi:MAG: caspase family protein [Bacteroidales bacterium]
MRNIDSKVILIITINCLFFFSLFSNTKYSDNYKEGTYPDKQKANKVQSLNATPPKRIALIIGNCNYSRDTFKFAANDAKLMKETLEKVNFDVTILIDKKYDEIANAIDTFLIKLRDDKSLTGLLYFTGNGIQVDGRNYFIPIDKEVNIIEEVWTNTISIHDILERLERIKNKLNIIIIDLPRTNKKRFTTGPHLNIEVFLPNETFIIYSCSPWAQPVYISEGNNSIFAFELNKAILEEEIDLSIVDKIVREKVYNKTNKKQVIWSSSSLSKKFYFKE